MLRMIALIAAAPGGDVGELKSVVTKAAQTATVDLAGLGEVRHAFASNNGPQATASSFTIESSDFAGMLEVIVPEEHLGAAIESLSGLADRLGAPVDAARSVVVVGRENLVLPGTGALQIHVALRRNPTLTHDEFLSCWENEFAPLVVITPHICGYRQVHTLHEQSAEASQALGLPFDGVDGVAVEWFPSAALLQEASVWSEELREHVEVRKQFLDGPGARSLLSDNSDA